MDIQSLTTDRATAMRVNDEGCTSDLQQGPGNSIPDASSFGWPMHGDASDGQPLTDRFSTVMLADAVPPLRDAGRATPDHGGPPAPHELIPPNRTPDTIAGWQAVSDNLLSAQCCAFHRNMEISSRYAWIYKLQPACFKWAAMAAIASHHVRLALFPLRLDTDRSGYVDITHSLGRRKMLLTKDVNTIRATNNAIFNDIFWVHLAYVTAEDGIESLRALLRAERHYAAILSGFEAIDQGRRVLEDATASTAARRTADDLIWTGNLQLLEHEQRALVQPNFDLLSCLFARLVSIGSATSFEVRGMRHEVAYFTSFYLYSITRGIPHAVRAQSWPRITRLDDRWRWLVSSVVPRFRRFDADSRLVDASLQRIFDEARASASTPCIHPVVAQATAIDNERARGTESA